MVIYPMAYMPQGHYRFGTNIPLQVEVRLIKAQQDKNSSRMTLIPPPSTYIHVLGLSTYCGSRLTHPRICVCIGEDN